MGRNGNRMFCRAEWKQGRLRGCVVANGVRAIAIVLGFVAGMPTPASAWGSEGHRLVAEVAQGQLTAAARADIDRLLALKPGSTLASISTWADEVRSPSTASWHYVNFPRDGDCRYEPDRMCLQGSCVVGAIERQTALLAFNAPDEERLKALKYVVHFVADVHQPLHAGFADDRGGNGYQLQAYGRGTNLHALWDSGFIRQWPGGAASLQAAVDAATHPTDGGSGARAWAEESCRVVSAEGFYPQGHKLGDDYPSGVRAVLVQQLAIAGSRLASVLNRSLGKR